MAASHGGRRGLVRLTPQGQAEIVLSGSGLVGLALLPSGRAILTTNGALFTGLLCGVVIIVGALTFFPALVLGPIVEHFIAQGGKVY